MAMQLSGSLNLTGSLNVNGSIIGSISATNGIVSSSTQVQNYDVFALNSNLYNSTGSIKGEIAGIEAYTASLKGAAIVSSSQQITNYYKFAETASANTFYGGQSVSGSVFVTSNVGFGTSDATGSGILKVISAGTQTAFSIGQSNSKRFTGFSANDLKVYGDDYFITTVDAFPISIGTNNISRITIANDGGISATGAITASNFRISTAGNGIDFSANSNAAGMTSELLNDYEEGTWTPSFGGTGGQSGQVYVTQDGTYTKVGRLVTFQGNIALSTKGTITGFVKINGLPFTGLGTPSIKPATTIAYNTQITTIPVSDAYGANNFMYLYKQSQTNPTTTTQLDINDLTDTTVWCVSGFYYTA